MVLQQQITLCTISPSKHHLGINDACVEDGEKKTFPDVIQLHFFSYFTNKKGSFYLVGCTRVSQKPAGTFLWLVMAWELQIVWVALLKRRPDGESGRRCFQPIDV